MEANRPTKAPHASTQSAGSSWCVWFIVPVTINAILQLLFQTVIVIYDGGAAQMAIFYYSIPYWVVAVLIGLRRWRQPTIGDALFLSFGQVI